MQTIEDDVRKLGIHTFPMPLGLKRDDANPLESKCIRCDTCDGYPCLVHAKSDSDINCIRQIMYMPNVTLMTNSRVTRLITNGEGTAFRSVEVIHSGSDTNAPEASKTGHTATLLLASGNDKFPTGLANRRAMRHSSRSDSFWKD